MISTTNSRIHITLSRRDKATITKLAKRDGVQPASKAADLLRIALEQEEDRVFGDIAVSRIQKRGRTVSLKDAWRMLSK